MEAIETDMFICNPEKFSSIFRWHFGPDTATCHSILSKFAQASFSRSSRRLRVVLGWA